MVDAISPGTQAMPAFVGLGGNGVQNEGAPKAYLNMMVFDRNYQQIGNTLFTQVSTAAEEDGTDVDYEFIPIWPITITEPGYVYIYVSNENGTPVEVFFDDFKVSHFPTEIVQKDDYYPFWGTFNSYVSGQENLYKYNGKEEQKETGWYDYGARNYDPWLGRFPNQDRFASKYFSLSPYGYAANNPLKYIDYNGDSLVAVTVRGLNGQNPTVADRQFLVDSKIAENFVGFAEAAINKFPALTVNNIFRSNSSSSITTSNTKAKGLSRHQAGFAVDFNGVRSLNTEELKELNGIASEFGFSPLTNQKSDLPHFSVDPTLKGFESLSSAVEENKGHFDQLVNSASEGGIKTSALTNGKGDVIGVKFEKGTNDAKSQDQFKNLINELIKNAR